MTASGSGLDPHISPESARIQIPALAAASGLSEEGLEQIVADNTEGSLFGHFRGRNRQCSRREPGGHLPRAMGCCGWMRQSKIALPAGFRLNGGTLCNSIFDKTLKSRNSSNDPDCTDETPAWLTINMPGKVLKGMAWSDRAGSILSRWEDAASIGV
ncbi:MAG: potassium-transporting ATPase subunit C [Oscillospiraceae bacterium]